MLMPAHNPFGPDCRPTAMPWNEGRYDLIFPPPKGFLRVLWHYGNVNNNSDHSSLYTVQDLRLGYAEWPSGQPKIDNRKN